MRRSDAISYCAAVVFSASAVQAEGPETVVSINHCADQYALLLGAEEQVVSVTHVAVDRNLSVMADRAEGKTLNRAGAEEVYRLDPEIVFASQWTAPFTVSLLEGFGVRVERVDGVDRVSDIPKRLQEVGVLLGRDQQAAEIAEQVHARIEEIEINHGVRPVAAFFGAGGYSVGEGSLANDILELAGFENLALRVGRRHGGYLPLETLLMERPDLIITSAAYPGSSQAEAVMDHPALKGIPKVEMTAAWSCGLPHALDAVEDLISLRKSLKINN